jgi:hypothetical protein
VIKKISYIFLLLLLFTNKINAQVIDSLKVESNTIINKRNFRPEFKDHYTSNHFIYEYDTKAETLSLWSRFLIWIVSKITSFFNSSTQATNFVNVFFKTLYIIIILLVIYFIVKTLVNQEGSWIFGRKSDKLNINTSEVEQHLMQTDFDNLITNAVKKQNYRLAVRYYYLKTLKLLSEKEIINWEYEKTNQDYYHEIKNKEIKASFSYTSYIYNYSWYGEFELDESGYQEASKSFNQLFKIIK